MKLIFFSYFRRNVPKLKEKRDAFLESATLGARRVRPRDVRNEAAKNTFHRCSAGTHTIRVIIFWLM